MWRKNSMGDNTVSFKSLEGVHELSGVDQYTFADKDRYDEEANGIHFMLDGKCYLAIEDPDDGYRSSLRWIEKTRKKPKNQFKPIRVRVVFEMTEQYELLTFFKWKSDKMVMQIGTDNCDDYYPSFIGYFDPSAVGRVKKEKC
jgi:hypothetical protein